MGSGTLICTSRLGNAVNEFLLLTLSSEGLEKHRIPIHQHTMLRSMFNRFDMYERIHVYSFMDVFMYVQYFSVYVYLLKVLKYFEGKSETTKIARP